ncbi:MAG: formylglycine-generating enzyme family protein [Myxococcota bacterium]
MKKTIIIAAMILSFAVVHEQNAKVQPPISGPDETVFIPGGVFTMGDDHQMPEEAPAHLVHVDGFWMMRTEVTNRSFARFVEATGYLTTAERPGPSGEPPASAVLTVPRTVEAGADHFDWWRMVEGASWRHPEGPGSSIDARSDHPVVHVSHDDAAAFCAWWGGRLPTEAEWERAARGGKEGLDYVWGDIYPKESAPPANVWTGHFPTYNDASDGWIRTAPVAQYPANPYGLHDMAGNVWEWTADWYRADYYRQSPRSNPKGPSRADAWNPKNPNEAQRTTRGGSFACAPNHCARFRPSARSATSPDTSLSHTGFRCTR